MARGNGGGCPQATTVLASNKLIRENWNLRYSAFFLLCPLPPGMTGETPLWVSVQRLNDRALPRNVLLVHRRDQHPRPPEELAVCVKPIHYDYNKVRLLPRPGVSDRRVRPRIQCGP